MQHYKGVYRLKAPIDVRYNQFSRKLDGTYEDIDVYIDCYNKIQISYFGHGILEVYCPSIGRGHNLIKAIKEEFHGDIIFNIKETSEEVLFQFKAQDIEKLEKYLKPKTSGANISPYSSRNLPRNKSYKIPDEDLIPYKEIVQKIGQNRIIELTHTTKDFIKSLATKKNTYDDIKADMALKGLKGKEYIHSIGKWSEYIEYLERNLQN